MAEPLSKLSRKKKVIFSTITVVLLFVLMDFVAGLILNGGSGVVEAEKRSMGAYKDKPWTDQFFQDSKDCVEQGIKKDPYPRTYVRYLGHDNYLDCATPTQNYAGGIRKTWNPDAAGTPARSVAIFGGSTLVGISTPDDMTIPSYFSHRANSGDNPAYFVINYGVGSYTYTQSLMKLILLLREGKRFDYVVMYNGANDIDNAYESGEAGALVSENIIRLKIEKQPLSEQILNSIRLLPQRCNLCKAFYIISRNTPILKDYVSPALSRARNYVDLKKGERGDDAKIEQLAKDIAEYYKKSHDLLDALAQAYHFRYVEFFQPTLFYDDKVIAGEEHLNNSRLTDQKLKTLYLRTREYLNAMYLEHFYDISDVLDNRQVPAYIDVVHVGAEANETIAGEMYELFKKDFE